MIAIRKPLNLISFIYVEDMLNRGGDIKGASQDYENYGEMNTWDVSNITDMTELFKDKTTFNENISSWDVSNVTNMSAMFRG